MLAKRRRLTAAQVRAVLARGRSSRAGILSVKRLPSSGTAQAVVVVSKSVVKSAVVRNRLRRALYRALAKTTFSGTNVFFVHKIPSPPLEPAFANDLNTLCSKQSS